LSNGCRIVKFTPEERREQQRLIAEQEESALMRALLRRHRKRQVRRATRADGVLARAYLGHLGKKLLC
jgi:hypothetical protein